MKTFAIEMPDSGDKEFMDAFQQVMDAVNDATNKEIQKVESDLGRY